MTEPQAETWLDSMGHQLTGLLPAGDAAGGIAYYALVIWDGPQLRFLSNVSGKGIAGALRKAIARLEKQEGGGSLPPPASRTVIVGDLGQDLEVADLEREPGAFGFPIPLHPDPQGIGTF